MRRFGIVFILALLGIGLCQAENLDIRSLHTLSNTMEHNEFLRLAVSHDSLTRSITTQQWYDELGLTSDDTLSMRLMPTLYDLVANDYCLRGLPNRDSVAQAWLDFHAKDTSTFPRLYISVNINDRGTADSLLSFYASLPDTWERGYVLSSFTNYRNPQFYQFVVNYLQQYPTSPFVSNILFAKKRCEQIEINYSCPASLRSSDSLTITYDNINAREIVFELYRLPERLPWRGKIGSSLVKVDSLRVVCDSSLIFRQKEMQCRMAPQKYGRYYVFARLQEDSLQKPVDSIDVDQIKEHSFFVSDLRCFVVNEYMFDVKRPRLVVVDARTGQPVKNVKLRRFLRFPRRTDSNGEVLLRKRPSNSIEGRLVYGEDKYNRFSIFSYRYDYADYCDFKFIPNATIFRPGDTLKLTVIGYQRHKYQSSLLKNTDVTITYDFPREEEKDTVLTLDDYGMATLVVPFTDDMARGWCYFTASVKYKRDEYSSSCSVRLEDYRFPSVNLMFDDSYKTKNRDDLSQITGKAMLSNGLPIVNTTVTARVTLIRPTYYVCNLTARTDNEGVFRLVLPDSLVSNLPDYRMMTVNATLTTPDGESVETEMSLPLQSPAPTATTPPDSINGVPQDSLLWLPADSTVVKGRQVTMRLGVPRSSWVYCVVSSRSKLLSHEWQQLSPGMHTYTFTLPDEQDDYLDVLFVSTSPEGKHIQCSRHIPGINWNELHITTVTMRDYLTPNAYETWVFRLTDANGRPEQARMALSMTDKALESLNSSAWKHPILPRWQHRYMWTCTPDYVSYPQTIISSIPRSQHGVIIFPPLLYEPYRIDSGQQVIIKGVVVDLNGEPVIGASVMEQGTRNGTITDYDGHFSLAVSKNAVIECSAVGMQQSVIPAYNDMYIVMYEQTEVLNEVVVTGYGEKNVVSEVEKKFGRFYEIRTYSAADDDICFEEELDLEANPQPSTQRSTSVPVRQGDTRLALYLPALQTDSAGEVHVHFLTPPDNTEWLMQAMAWSDLCASDYITRTFIARRTLMLRLQLPRFMRHGDELSLPCVISNTADTARQVTVSVQIRDAASDSLLATHTFTPRLSASASETLFFPYKAKTNGNIIVRAEVRDNQGTSDGEQRLLHILPIVEPVSESIPFYLHAGDTAITLCTSAPNGAENRKVTLMLCNNPLAYIAAGLPQSIDSSAVTVTMLSHNLYALALRNRLAQIYPSLIKPVDISYLVRELNHYQRGTGAFSWLKNDRSTASFYLTLRVLALFGELQEADGLENNLKYSKQLAVSYIDREIVRKETDYRKAHHDSLPDYTDYVIYAYVRAMFDEKQNDDVHRIFSATLDSLYTSLNTSELTEWPLLALMFERAGQHDRALTIVNGLRRYATLDEAHGMYWNNLPDRWWWYRQADIQASFLLAFSKIDPQQHELDAMRQWLILNNRTTKWGTSSLNAYVTYVLMRTLPSSAIPNDSTSLQYIPLPDTTVRYTLHHETATPAWGALMTSYSAPANMLKPFSTSAMKIERIFERIDATGTSLNKGDRVRVKLRITTDREMDNVIITDHRSALLEPMGMSDFGWENGALYYREIRNADQILYVEHLQRGITVLTYDCYVTASGTTLAGLASATSELAPEFTTHTGSTLLNAQ